MTGTELTIAACIGAIVLGMLYFVFFRLSGAGGSGARRSADALLSIPELQAANELRTPDDNTEIEIPYWEPGSNERREVREVQESALRAVGPGGGGSSKLRHELTVEEEYQEHSIEKNTDEIHGTRVEAEFELVTVREGQSAQKNKKLFGTLQVERKADGTLALDGAPEASDPQIRPLFQSLWAHVGQEDPVRRAIAERPVKSGAPLPVDAEEWASFLDVDHVTDLDVRLDGLSEKAAGFRIRFRAEDRTLFGRYWQEREELLVLERATGRPLGRRWTAEQGSRLGILFLALRSSGVSGGVREVNDG